METRKDLKPSDFWKLLLTLKSGEWITDEIFGISIKTIWAGIIAGLVLHKVKKRVTEK